MQGNKFGHILIAKIENDSTNNHKVDMIQKIYNFKT